MVCRDDSSVVVSCVDAGSGALASLEGQVLFMFLFHAVLWRLFY